MKAAQFHSLWHSGHHLTSGLRRKIQKRISGEIYFNFSRFSFRMSDEVKVARRCHLLLRQVESRVQKPPLRVRSVFIQSYVNYPFRSGVKICSRVGG